MPTLGEHIREQRLTLGLSLGQLASKLGLTASVVRSWERDQVTPNRPQLDTVAELLETDIDELVALAPEAAPEPTPELVVESEPEPVVVEPEPELVVESEPEPVVVVEPEPELVVESEPEPVVVEPEPEEGPDVGEPEGVAPEETKPPVEAGSAGTSPVDEAAPDAERIGDLETEQVAMSDVIAEAEEEVAPVPATHQRRSFLAYWQDPDQRLRYYIRWVATAVVMLVLAVVLVWAVGELLDAVGQVTDQFGTQEVDELESLRLTSAL